MHHVLRAALLAFLAASLVEAQVVEERGLRFERLFGTGDQVPGAPLGEVFDGLGDPQLAGEWVASFASSFWSGYGIYVWHNGQSFVVADDWTVLPDVPGTQIWQARTPESYSVDRSGLAAFTAEFQSTEVAYGMGVWGWRDGELFLVAGPGSEVPGKPGRQLGGAYAPVVDDGTIYVAGYWLEDDHFEGAIFRYREGEGLSIAFEGIIVSSPAPDYVAARDGLLFAAGMVEEAGITRSVIVRWREGMAAPEELLDFTGSWLPASVAASGLGAAITVFGSSPGPEPGGVYRISDLGVDLVVAPTGIDPHSGEPIFALNPSVAIDGLDVAYVTRVLNLGVRTYIQGVDGEPRMILGEGDSFAGSRVIALSPKNQSFDSGRLAMGIGLENNDGAIWLVDLSSPLGVPTIPVLDPRGLLALALALGVAGAWVIGRQHGATRRTRSLRNE